MSIAKTVFYICGIIFFLIVIVAAFIFIWKTVQTSNTIKRVLTSPELEDLILRAKDRILPLIEGVRI